DGELQLHYFDRRFPIEPTSALSVLKKAANIESESRTDAEAGKDSRLPGEDRDGLGAPQQVSPAPVRDPGQHEAPTVPTPPARTRLASLVERSPRIRAAIDAAVSSYNGTPGQPDTFDRLDDLLDRQPYRVAHWKTAFDEINYRRFFDINDLGAIRMEDCR